MGVKISVNGEKYKVKSKNWYLNMIDYPIQIDGQEIRVVAVGNKVDLAVDGVFLGSGEAYTPLNYMPSGVNVYMGISCIGGFVMAGVIGLLIGACFSKSYAKKALEAGSTKAIIGDFIMCTVIQIILVFVLVYALY
ncbi:MAG: hypothetical protein IJP31_06910 [Lachnospiraceae bacterium]|nr:hypothetical protein [Lachnospiraceae bacterium]